MPSSGSITGKPVFSISARRTSSVLSCIRNIRRSTSITRPIASAADMPRKITIIFKLSSESVADAGAVLITGPANAKIELIKHIHQHDPDRMKVIAGVETVDHPSDGALSLTPENTSRPPIGWSLRRSEPSYQIWLARTEKILQFLFLGEFASAGQSGVRPIVDRSAVFDGRHGHYRSRFLETAMSYST